MSILSPGTAVAVRIINPEIYANGFPEFFQDKTGRVLEYREEYGFGEGPHYLVSFDAPQHFPGHWEPFTRFWFPVTDLVTR